MILEPKTVETDDQYRICLDEVGRLVAADPEPGTPDGDRLALLATLVEDYEKERFQFKRP